MTASKLDVDHMVPLKNAHLSGGWAWDAATKRRYANVLADTPHLIAVTASANRSKGAKSPDQWKPPNTAYWCTYATDWVGVKTTWGLTVTRAEAEALTTMLATCGTTVTITQSPAPTPAPTPSPTPTPTPTPTAPTTAGFEIIALNCTGTPESVTVRNTGSQAADLGNWSIHDEGANTRTSSLLAPQSSPVPLCQCGHTQELHNKPCSGKAVLYGTTAGTRPSCSTRPGPSSASAPAHSQPILTVTFHPRSTPIDGP
jgi:hypothetical protein